MNKKHFLQRIILCLLGLLFLVPLYAQTGNYCYTERTDLRRYDNGKYTGLRSREVRSFITKKNSSAKETFYDGNFYVWQETRRNRQSVQGKINEAIPASFILTSEGQMQMLEDKGFPSFRSFPALVAGEKSWTAEAVRVVDPKEKGVFTHIPFLALYTFVKEEKYKGQDCLLLKADWATRYGGDNIDVEGDPDLVRAEGSHKATMYINKKTGAALVVRDEVDETYFYKDGSSVAFKGSISLFTDYAPAVDHKAVIKEAKKTNVQIPIEQTDSGLRLTISNLNFVPDSAELLPGQEEVLKNIASVLLQAKSSSFLVAGHTADTNEPISEMQLSKERAFAVAKMLALYGIPEEKFICKGYGATRPLADNSTKEGMAKNRRVEITILE